MVHVTDPAFPPPVRYLPPRWLTVLTWVGYVYVLYLAIAVGRPYQRVLLAAMTVLNLGSLWYRALSRRAYKRAVMYYAQAEESRAKLIEIQRRLDGMTDA